MRAVFDVGSNSVRLAVADVKNGKLVNQQTYLAFSRLAEGRAADGSLTEPAMLRTFQAVQSLMPRLGRLPRCSEHLLVTATAALRQAPNRRFLMDRLEELCGVPVRLLSPQEEAYYGFTGALAGSDTAAAEALVLDIGGGSTELSYFHKDRWSSKSFPYGCLVLKDHPDRLGHFRADLRENLSASILKEKRLIGIGGTLTTLAAILLGLDTYDPEAIHKSRIKRSDWLSFMQSYAAMTPSERARIPGLAAERRDTILPGLLILDVICSSFQLEGYTASVTDGLDGLLLNNLYGGSEQR